MPPLLLMVLANIATEKHNKKKILNKGRLNYE